MPQFSESFFSEDDLSPLNEYELNPTGDNVVVNSKDSINWFLANVKGYYKTNLKIAHLNINSLLNKLDEVKNKLDGYLFDILFISETKLDSTTSDFDFFLQQSGYRTIRRDRKKGAGDLIAFVYVKIYPYLGDAIWNQNLPKQCVWMLWIQEKPALLYVLATDHPNFAKYLISYYVRESLRDLFDWRF